jgi:hypothetical protein
MARPMFEENVRLHDHHVFVELAEAINAARAAEAEFR